MRTLGIESMSSPGAPFIGREKELAELRAGLDGALGGNGHLFLISGQPGVGKTRLAEQLASEAETRGVRVLWGRCWEGDGRPAFWPWVQALRSYVAACEPRALASELGAQGPILSQLVPEIRARLPNLIGASLPSDADQARFVLFDAIVSLLRAISRNEPLL